MKKTIYIGLAVIIALMVCGCQPEIQTYDLKLVFQDTGEFSADAIIRAAEEIELLTGGNVIISVIPNSECGVIDPEYEVVHGDFDMAFLRAPTQSGYMDEIVYLPFYVTNYDEGNAVWTEGSRFYSVYDEIQASKGIKLLGFFPAGFMGLGVNDMNPDKFFDFTIAKDELLRIPEIDTFKIMTETMGFRAAEFMFSDVAYAFKTDVIQGWIGGGAQTNYEEFRDLIECYVDYRYANNLFTAIINMEVFDSLPSEYQDIMMRAFNLESQAAIEERDILDERALADLADAGITVIVPSPEERDEMAAYMREHTWPLLEGKFGKDVIDSLK